MNFEFSWSELPAVLCGLRVELRRVLIRSSVFWGTVRDGGGLQLNDGRVVNSQSLPRLPPVNPSKVNAVHVSYLWRSMETRNSL